MKRELPLYDTLTKRSEKGSLRFHMPGHKGKNIPESPLAGAMSLDFTELYGTGNLYDGLWPIADAEKLASRAWNVPQAFFLTGGASQGILSMLSIVRQSTQHILVDRGCHKSVYNGLGLMDFTPIYLVPETFEPFGCAKAYAKEYIESMLNQNPEIGAVILTSPTYYGILSDIEGIAEVVHAHGAWLLVDEAHGAHLPFLRGYHSAVSQGADMAVCSMHKTLPTLGQAALLHANEKVPAFTVRRATALFGTSSPSYNVMASMDLSRDFMEHVGKLIGDKLAVFVQEIRSEINQVGILKALVTEKMDPLRLCVMTSCAGISGYRAAQILEEEYGIVCEMADERNVLFIITVADMIEELKKLQSAIRALERYKSNLIVERKPCSGLAQVACTPRQAMIAPCKQIPLGDAAGRVAAANLCPYPPGIPVVALGEVIETHHLAYLYHNGFSEDDLVLIAEQDF